MRRVYLALLMSITATLVSAIAATASVAFTEYNGVIGGKFKVEGGTQTWEYTEEESTTKVTLKCSKVTFDVTLVSKTELEGVPSFAGCTDNGLAAVVTNKCAFNFHIGGTVDINGGAECFTVTVTSTKCVKRVNGGQKGLKRIAFTNQGADLVIEQHIEGIKFVTSTGKSCGFKNESAKGTTTLVGNITVKGITAN